MGFELVCSIILIENRIFKLNIWEKDGLGIRKHTCETIWFRALRQLQSTEYIETDDISVLLLLPREWLFGEWLHFPYVYSMV